MEKNELNKKYELQIEVLTPLHVGAGAEKDWVQGSDFIVDNKQVKILNLKKVSQFVAISDLTDALLRKDSNALKAKLAGDIDKCIDKTFEGNYFGSNDIKVFIKNGLTNEPIIPGSSIKGAIRSIIIDYLLDDNSKRNKKLDERELLGKANDGDELMRFIKVSDAAFENTNIVNTKIFNLLSTTEGGWKHDRNSTTKTFNKEGFNSFYEVIEPKEKSTLSISLSEKAFSNYAEKIKPFSPRKTQIIKNDLSGLFQIINSHTKKYLEKEKEFFVKYSTDKTDKIIENINSVISQIPTNGEYCILKMAAGSGFHSITGDWQFDDYSIDKLFYEEEKWGKIKTVSRGMQNGNRSAKSRKIAIQGDNFSLMGFIKLKVRTEEDILLEKEAVLQKQKELEAKRLAEKIAHDELLRKKKEQQEAELAEKQRIFEETLRAENERIAEEKRIEESRLLKIQQEEEERKRKKDELANAAKSGIPAHLTSITDFEKFKKEADKWIALLPDKSIKGSGFEEDFISQILRVAKDELSKGGRSAKLWREKNHLHKIGLWLSPETAQSWFSEITKE